MPIPKYWSKAVTQLKCRMGRVPFDGEVSKWGGSDRSSDDARRVATRMVEDLAGRVAERGKWPDAYWEYSGGPLLREEVLEEIPSPRGTALGLISRNRYGCRVLNTHRVAFVDIDDPSIPIPAMPLGQLILRFFGFSTKPTTIPVPPISELDVPVSLHKFSQNHPNWGLRIYRTAAGWRIILTHATFDPVGSSIQDAMMQMGADSLYMKLCRGQKLFRARLTPKPWRIGLASPEIRWPVENPEVLAGLKSWLRHYERASSGKSVCQFHSHFGPELVKDPEIERVIQLHDQSCVGPESAVLA